MDNANPDPMKDVKGGRDGKATPVMQAQVAGPARMRRRHVGLLRGFYLFVCLPLIIVAGYLYFVAQPQYASTMGFAVRSEEAAAPADLLGGIVSLSGSSSGGSDTDVLFEFIRSQRMVRAVDQRMGLRTIWLRLAIRFSAWPRMPRLKICSPIGSVW